MPTYNILEMSSVFPQQDGPQTAMNSWSVVEIILFITADLEERIQLYKRENGKPKCGLLTVKTEKNQLGERYSYKLNFYNDLCNVYNR